MNVSDSSEPVGAPTELADAEEVPDWFANSVKAIFSVPILVGFLCGGIPSLLAVCWCIGQLLL